VRMSAHPGHADDLSDLPMSGPYVRCLGDGRQARYRLRANVMKSPMSPGQNWPGVGHDPEEHPQVVRGGQHRVRRAPPGHERTEDKLMSDQFPKEHPVYKKNTKKPIPIVTGTHK
jgi:hypothetical protein